MHYIRLEFGFVDSSDPFAVRHPRGSTLTLTLTLATGSSLKIDFLLISYLS